MITNGIRFSKTIFSIWDLTPVFSLLFLIFFTASLSGEGKYFLCIDGGGSKTHLQVVDENGQVVSLTHKGNPVDHVEAAGSNINTVGIEGVKEAFRTLIEDVQIGGESLVALLPQCQVIAGMAGVGLPKNQQAVACVWEEAGVDKDDILVMADAEMALELLGDEGIVLISGTGSICLGKREGKRFRVGGLGRVLGDEGSGYEIGLHALQAALAQEYGWGAHTKLTADLREFFSVLELKNLIPQINRGEMSPSQIARVAPLVFAAAGQGDKVAAEIIQKSAHDLADLLTKMGAISQLSHTEVHVWGGVFKSPYAEEFLAQILGQVSGSLKVTNQARHNVARIFFNFRKSQQGQ